MIVDSVIISLAPLICSQCELLVQTQVYTFQLCADHHSLANCIKPQALHEVVQEITAEERTKYLALAGTKPVFVPRS